MNKIQQFIVDNKIDLSGTGSELNGNCVILAGFLCYLLVKEDKVELDGLNLIQFLELSPEAETELERVFKYAWTAGYEDFWETEDAKEEYIF